MTNHILLADDEENILSSLTFVLEDAGYAVTQATNGAQALTEIMACVDGSDAVDLLITDLRMPVMSGLDLIESIRNEGLQIPVIAITAFRSKDTCHALEGLDCVLCLSKPFAPRRILGLVEQAFASVDQ